MAENEDIAVTKFREYLRVNTEHPNPDRGKEYVKKAVFLVRKNWGGHHFFMHASAIPRFIRLFSSFLP